MIWLLPHSLVPPTLPSESSNSDTQEALGKRDNFVEDKHIPFLVAWCFLISWQVNCAENLKHIFPEMKLHGPFPISTFMHLWAIYIFPQSVFGRPIVELWKHINRWHIYAWTKELRHQSLNVVFIGHFCLGWWSNFVGFKSGQKQSLKLLQNMVHSTFSLEKGGGRLERRYSTVL